MRLNQFIAQAGLCSRRGADALIKEKRVKVNGKVISQPWLNIGDKDSVEVDGQSIFLEGKIYIIFNKPKGVTTTLKDRFANKKIIDFIPKKFERVYPVGRLDKESRGLIILTNDGDLCYKLTHPKFAVEKEYILWIKGEVDRIILDKLRRGIKDGRDLLKVKSASIEKVSVGKTKLKVCVQEGKKRHLRRLCRKLGFSVLDLQRVRIGDLRLSNLQEGNYRFIKKEIIYNMALPKRLRYRPQGGQEQ